MGRLTFTPTALYVFRDYEFDHEGMPIKVDGDHSTFAWFDYAEIARILRNARGATDSNLVLNVTSASDGVRIHWVQGSPTKTKLPTYFSVSNYEGIDGTGTEKLEVNSIPYTPYEGLSLEDAFSESGYGITGFTLQHSPLIGDLGANDIYLEVNGDWTNARPTLNRPVGGEVQDVHEKTTFQWNHNGALNQKSFDLRYRKKGTSTWSNATGATSNQSYSLPGDSLPEGEYEWQVRTTSEYDFDSPWSSSAVFNVADITPTPNITYPHSSKDVPISDFTVNWSSVNQHEYEMELLQGNSVIYQKKAVSSNQEVERKNILENNTSYTVRLRVNQKNGLWSAWASVGFKVSYTAPARPILTITPNEEESNLKIEVDNPFPTGTQPNAVNQELFRRHDGGNWIKLANLLPNDQYIDYAVASNKVYEYRVKVQANNDTSNMSIIYKGSVSIKDAVISLARDLSQYVRLRFNPERSFGIDFNAEVKHFAGRKKPVVEYGEAIEMDGSISYLVLKDDFMQLRELAYKQETMLYRDSRGRKYYMSITSLETTDDLKLVHYYNVDLSLVEVDYIEAIE